MAKAKHMTHDTTRSEGTSAPKFGPQRHDENGYEVLDPTPMQPPLGYKKTLSLNEQIMQQVRIYKQQLLEDDAINETDEEADDFDTGEDFEPLSQYENDHIPSVKKLKQQAKELNAKREEAIRKKAIEDYQKQQEKAGGAAAPPKEPSLTETGKP